MQSKKESRKLAYDVLLATSTNLRSPESNSADSDLQRLFTMVSYIKYSILNMFPFVLFGFEIYYKCLACPTVTICFLLLVISAEHFFVKLMVFSLHLGME